MSLNILNKNKIKFDYFKFSLKRGSLSTMNDFRNFYIIFTIFIFLINSIVFSLSFQINIFLTIFLFSFYVLILIIDKFKIFNFMHLFENIVSSVILITVLFYFYIYISFFNFLNLTFLSKLNLFIVNILNTYDLTLISKVYNTYLSSLNNVFGDDNLFGFVSFSNSIYYYIQQSNESILSFSSVIHFFIFLFFILNCIGIISSKNPVNSLLFLISVYVYSSMLLILYTLEFFALLYVIIYVGAIAVLFLFVIMMLKFEKVSEYKEKKSFNKYKVFMGFLIIPLTFFFFKLYKSKFLIDLSFLRQQNVRLSFLEYQSAYANHNDVHNLSRETFTVNYLNIPSSLNDLESLGLSFYSEYSIIFLLLGVILLISIIAPILLTFKNRLGVKKQYHSEQLLRKKKDIISLKTI